MRYGLVVLCVILTGCGDGKVADGPISKICDTYKDICDVTHSGALCSLSKSQAVRSLAKQREQLSSINTYQALKSLDVYKNCLENAFISVSVRNKSTKQSQNTAIQRIPEMQKKIIHSTRRLPHPEVNLWLWSHSQSEDHWESMVNGVELVKDIHMDVYLALMTQTARKDIEKALVYANLALGKAEIIADIPASLYEFYVNYYLDKNELEKAAVWQGLHSALDQEEASVNSKYFKLYEKMTRGQISRAQQKVDALLDSNLEDLISSVSAL